VNNAPNWKQWEQLGKARFRRVAPGMWKNPHFCGVFAISLKKVAFFPHISGFFPCVLQKPSL